MQFVGLNFDVDSAGRASNIYLSSCNDMAFPLTFYVPLTLCFREGARYIAVVLPVVFAEKSAEALLIPSGADPVGLASCARSFCWAWIWSNVDLHSP